MKNNTRQHLKSCIGWIVVPVLKRIRYRKNLKRFSADVLRIKNILENLDSKKQRVFYLGVTAHSNLGDMGQHYCICKWINENYPDVDLIKVESDTVVFPQTNFISVLKQYYREGDVIVFQSGYTTQDMGGNHEEMHRLICDNMPDAHILMLPQTILFQHEENKLRCSNSYNQAKRMLFLTRDMVSFNSAKEMFHDIHVEAFPDIVTTLIGTLSFNHDRKGICLCRRDDTEKYYAEKDLMNLKQKLEMLTPVTVSDTTIAKSYQEIRADLKASIEGEIEKFSKFEATITDRYHGTIFSLVAGTPVIIIKSNDHKVVTGADWFKGIYDDYIYVAEDLDDAYRIYTEISQKQLDHKLQPYFKKQYYDQLKAKFENI